MIGAGDVVLPVDALACLVHFHHRARLDRRVAHDPAFRGDEGASALVELGLGDRLEEVLLPAGEGEDRFHLAEHLLDQLRPGDLPSLGAVLVPLLGGRGHVLHLVGVPAAAADLRRLVVGVHLHGEAADVLPPDELGGRGLAQLRLLEAELLAVDVEAVTGDRRPLQEEVVIGEVGLDDVVVDDLAVVDIGGKPVALRDLLRQVRVLHVLVRLGLRPFGEALSLVEPGHQEARRPVRSEHYLQGLHFGLADRLQLPDVAELDLDLGARLELVALGPLAADVGDVQLEPRRPVHVVRAADADDRAGQVRAGLLPVDEQLEGGHQPLVVRHERGPRAPPGGLMGRSVEGPPYDEASEPYRSRRASGPLPWKW